MSADREATMKLTAREAAQLEAAGVGGGQQEYKVTWEIELTAGSHREAAEQARTIQRNPLSWAVTFDVTDEAGETERVDLLDNNELDDHEEG